MWMKLLQFAITYLLDLLVGKLYKSYEEDKERKEQDLISKTEIKKKVKAIKDAKTKEELRIAINNLNL